VRRSGHNRQSRRRVTNRNRRVQWTGVGPRGLCYVPAAVQGSSGIARRALAPWALAAALGLACCGGGATQDAGAPSGDFRVQIVRASFPAEQRIARSERLVIAVRNAGERVIPNVAVSVDAFTERSDQAGLADPERSVWVLDAEPRGGVTATTGTWALGPLRPGQTRRFVWRVTAVRTGRHVVRWRVDADLAGSARAVLAGGRPPAGRFTVAISGRPSPAHVDPDTGAVVRGAD
jgi:hypothetical protein